MGMRHLLSAIGRSPRYHQQRSMRKMLIGYTLDLANTGKDAALAKAMRPEKEMVEMIQNSSPQGILLRKHKQQLKSEMKRKMKMTSHSSNPILSSWSIMDQTPLRRHCEVQINIT